MVFDEYASTKSLLANFHYDNSVIDSFFTKRGFKVLPNSFSNYNFTPFSMASILNMDYLKDIENVSEIKGADYNKCGTLIKENKVIKLLSSYGYDIVNCSVFDLEGLPSSFEISLLPSKTRLITDQTLYNCFMNDIGWHWNLNWLNTHDRAFTLLEGNNRMVQQVINESAIQNNKPKFLYAHFEMPHAPFFYTANNQLRSREEVLRTNNYGTPEEYLEYLPYVNAKVEALITSVQENTKGKAVIIAMGDHGYRTLIKGISNEHYFQNLNAIYLPSKDYHLLKDSVSAVNQFRTVFNTLFKQSFEMLPDSSIFLKDKPN
ncbi:MAG: sulfatase-like hydrolase/transferase [Chitinophagaceae bacterium]